MRQQSPLQRILMLAVCVAGLTGPARAVEPVLVFSAKSANELIDDAKHVATQAGKPEFAGLIEGMIGQFTQGKGLAGIDRTQPFGAYLILAPEGQPSLPVVFLPVSNADDFKDLLTNWFPMQEDLDDDVFRLTREDTQIYCKIHNNYCYATLIPTSLEDLPDVAKLANRDHDLALSANFAQVPAQYKTLFLTQVKANTDAEAAQRPPAKSEAERRGREFGEAITLAAMKSVVEQGQQCLLGIDINRQSKTLGVNLQLKATPDSDLAEAFSRYATTSSPFSGLVGNDTLMSLLVSVPLSASIRDGIQQLFIDAKQEGEKTIAANPNLPTEAEKQIARDSFDKLMEISQATLTRETIDAAIVLNSTDGSKLQVIVGMKIAKGEELSGALTEAVVSAINKGNSAQNLKLDVAAHAGARIHSVATRFDDEEQRQKFGEGPAYFAIAKDSLWVAVGENALPSLKDSLDALAKTKQRHAPISLNFSPAKLNQTFADGASATTPANEDIDRAQFEVRPVNGGIEFKLEVSDSALKLTADP